jgi:hypothetical protein
MSQVDVALSADTAPLSVDTAPLSAVTGEVTPGAGGLAGHRRRRSLSWRV